jgi:hypothetical protein
MENFVFHSMSGSMFIPMMPGPGFSALKNLMSLLRPFALQTSISSRFLEGLSF